MLMELLQKNNIPNDYPPSNNTTNENLFNMPVIDK